MVDFAHARKVMVDTQLLPGGITDRRILSAMGRVPRERFVPETRRGLAYIDDVQALDEASGLRALPAPAPFAKLLQLAEIGSHERVLDIGCATGYSTAVIAALAAHVTGLEDDAELVAAAVDNIARLGITNAEIVEGWIEDLPQDATAFDVVIVEGSVSALPDALFSRVRDGGRLVAIVQDGVASVAKLFVKSGGGVAAREAFNAYMPPLPRLGRVETFVF